jgi:hypothetical protein
VLQRLSPLAMVVASWAVTVAAFAQERAAPAVTLTFPELLAPTARELKPSPRLASLTGKRVRMVGFMARMEIPPKGSFWLTAAPLVCDEAGGGTADLPPDAIRVEVPALEGQELPWTDRAVEVVGTLEVGRRVHPDTQVSSIRIVLDLQAPRSAASADPEPRPGTTPGTSKGEKP